MALLLSGRGITGESLRNLKNRHRPYCHLIHTDIAVFILVSYMLGSSSRLKSSGTLATFVLDVKCVATVVLAVFGPRRASCCSCLPTNSSEISQVTPTSRQSCLLDGPCNKDCLHVPLYFPKLLFTTWCFPASEQNCSVVLRSQTRRRPHRTSRLTRSLNDTG